MGLPMARNLIAAGHVVTGFDVAAAALEHLAAHGGNAAASVLEVCEGADAIVTMLPAASHVREVYGTGGVIATAGPQTLLIDCSTIDVGTAREMAGRAAARGLAMLDAPVS